MSRGKRGQRHCSIQGIKNPIVRTDMKYPRRRAGDCTSTTYTRYGRFSRTPPTAVGGLFRSILEGSGKAQRLYLNDPPAAAWGISYVCPYSRVIGVSFFPATAVQLPS